MMRRYGPLFDLAAGESAKEAGLSTAAKCRDPLLTLARDAVRNVALSRPDRLATADDAYAVLGDMGKDASALGNAAGSLFRGQEWESTGKWAASRRKSSHARMVRVWRLRG
jgi:hypothetical protein